MATENIFFIILILTIVCCLLCSCSALIKHMHKMCKCSSDCNCGCQNGGGCRCQNGEDCGCQSYNQTSDPIKLDNSKNMQVNMSSGEPSQGIIPEQPEYNVVVSDGIHAKVEQIDGRDYVFLPNSLAGYVE